MYIQTCCYPSKTLDDFRCLNCQCVARSEVASPVLCSFDQNFLPPLQEAQKSEKGNIALARGMQQDASPLSSFWTGDKPGQRPASVRSLSSSMNSSLHGYPVFDPQEQNPVFSTARQRSDSADFNIMSPGLPPPPVELDRTKTFECDICGESITVQRRLEWQ
jgi:hypothetical protein